MRLSTTKLLIAITCLHSNTFVVASLRKASKGKHKDVLINPPDLVDSGTSNPIQTTDSISRVPTLAPAVQAVPTISSLVPTLRPTFPTMSPSDGSNTKSDTPSISPSDVKSDVPSQSQTIDSSIPTTLVSMKPTIALPNGIEGSTFGSNVFIIDSFNMSVQAIQGLFDDIYAKQVNNEMGIERYSFFFKPGTYGSPTEPLMLKLGYYTEVAGLGANPTDVIINGKIEVYNRCFKGQEYNETGLFIPYEGPEGNPRVCFALNNFWRSLSNLAINIVSLNQDTCRSRAMFWAISQASSMRRVDIRGGEMSLMDYCTEPGFASGGFIADTRATSIFSGGQQQFLTRNTQISSWDGGVWNQMFLGVEGAPDDSVFPKPPYTTINTNPLSREKPYLFISNPDVDGIDAYSVRVPFAVKDSRGISWDNDVLTPGRTIPLRDFFIVNTMTSVQAINQALSEGSNLLFSPGVYKIDESIVIDNTNTIVLGMGQATLTASSGNIAIKISDKPGIVIAGITVDAGTVLSKVLVEVGPRGSAGTGNSTTDNPITLSDVYFRVGGPHVGKADICLEVNSDNVLIDHTWIWRADHGIEGFDSTDGYDGDTERWKTNIGRVGIVVNGNNVTSTGLFVEHYQEHNVIWNGEGGRVYFFQNELPYDPPSQNDWIQPDGTLGWAAYKVNQNVTKHEFWSGGVYCYNRNSPLVVTSMGFDVPDTPGVQLRKTYTRNLNGPGIINTIINGIGTKVDSNFQGPAYVLNYPTTF